MVNAQHATQTFNTQQITNNRSQKKMHTKSYTKHTTHDTHLKPNIKRTTTCTTHKTCVLTKHVCVCDSAAEETRDQGGGGGDHAAGVGGGARDGARDGAGGGGLREEGEGARLQATDGQGGVEGARGHPGPGAANTHQDLRGRVSPPNDCCHVCHWPLRKRSLINIH